MYKYQPQSEVIKENNNICVNCSKDVYDLLKAYTHKKQEHFILVCLNARNDVITKKGITKGTIDASLYHPREVFAPAIVARSSKIIVAHNHPSGSLEVSTNDLVMTEKIKLAGEILGIRLVDSVIVSKEG